MESPLTPTPISFSNDTIVAVSTPPGTGGIAVIRISGPDAVEICGSVWRGRPLKTCDSHTVHLGRIVDESGETLDEVLATLYLAPNSYTGDDTIELACHGSRWIQREMVNLLIRSGARGAERGEFSQRAFLNGRLDLAQAEGIVDLIASSSRTAHRLAMQQATGAFSQRLDDLRHQLIDFASLLELELDFSEEDVEFADRMRLINLADRIIMEVDRLTDSYSQGKAFKDGIPVVIAGEPNAGKSTLLNRLLEEDKAIVSDIPGTTRDVIEDTREIDGVLFRFVDTAGLRDTADSIERIGIDRATDRIRRAAIILWLIDPVKDLESQLTMIREKQQILDETVSQYLIINKTDLISESRLDSLKIQLPEEMPIIMISASEGTGIDTLTEILIKEAREMQTNAGEIMVTNARHYESLLKGGRALRRARTLLTENQSADFIAQDVREALHYLGEITGAITTSTLLHSIFSRFCIGK